MVAGTVDGLLAFAGWSGSASGLGKVVEGVPSPSGSSLAAICVFPEDRFVDVGEVVVDVGDVGLPVAPGSVGSVLLGAGSEPRGSLSS
jgi:hypothetical protein